ncbi:CRISPR-associated endonuclease Cas2 [Streptomyces carpaticus]|uniref:CRISPR-associated endonuclease Cas2 n=1 Tax=Streptomyces carpaticus TaxID=285558 RepID=UPI0031F7BDCC
MMDLLLTYDVDTTDPGGARRLQRVAKLCEGYGLRVQKSVFEIVADEADYLRLLARIDEIIDAERDSVRIYRLPHHGLAAVQTCGTARLESHRDDLII